MLSQCGFRGFFCATNFGVYVYILGIYFSQNKKDGAREPQVK